MAQESKSKVLIAGAGPAGCICAYYLQNDFDVTVIDKKSPLLTLLPTGGGRCNLAHSEYDFRELAKNYPRGEKFLYSVFSRFSTSDTVEFFENIGVDTYTQYDGRIFPVSNSSKDVKEKFLNALKKVKFKKEEVLRINKADSGFKVVTDMNCYGADFVVIATGGHASFELVRLLGHKITDLKPALTGLKTKYLIHPMGEDGGEWADGFPELSGISIGGILFTHKGISGPEVYRISSLKARDNFPYRLVFDFCDFKDLQPILNDNPHKSIKNLLGEFLPKSFVEYVLKGLDIDIDSKCHTLDGKTRDRIIRAFSKFEVEVTGAVPDGEVVMSGGVDLREVSPKTLESKLVEGIYFCGEVLDIDGFCGGFNLQNCWSTGFVVAEGIKSRYFIH